jgi:coproporphyrinogen III oxidase
MLSKNQTGPLRSKWITYIEGLQEVICSALETADGGGRFKEDRWLRKEEHPASESSAGGGGRTRVLSEGALFEKAGVNTSVVWGKVTETMNKQLSMTGSHWFAAGISIVIHPLNPYVPTIHANWRYFELYDDSEQVTDRWFGGGSDLTPYYLFEEDASHFHQTLRHAAAGFGQDLYGRFKNQCDGYFINLHRSGEARGIGGVFYDHLKPTTEAEAERWFKFQQSNGNAFLPSYIPIVEKRKDTPYGTREKRWQEIRRGRYVEFNLVYDRGTLFGLKTQGRTESILMSLPPTVRFEYDYKPEAGTEEDKLLQVCLKPRSWV